MRMSIHHLIVFSLKISQFLDRWISIQWFTSLPSCYVTDTQIGSSRLDRCRLPRPLTDLPDPITSRLLAGATLGAGMPRHCSFPHGRRRRGRCWRRPPPLPPRSPPLLSPTIFPVSGGAPRPLPVTPT